MTALIVALILTVTSALGGGATFASQSALPGDTLYSVKLGVESLQERLAVGDESQAEAQLGCAGRRLSEAEKTIDAGRTDATAIALESLSACLQRADQHLGQAAASGKPVDELATRLTENLARLQGSLEAVQDRAPEPAREAIQKAIENTEKGLDTATALADKKPRSGGKTVSLSETVPVTPTVTPTAVPPTATATATPLPSVTPVPGVDGDGPKLAPGIPATVGITLTQTISDAQKLKDDPQIPGESQEGLLAKLRAARESLERGHGNAALNQLDAFLNQLNAMHRSGHITEDNYQALLADYQRLVQALGATPGAAVPAKPGHSPTAIPITAPTSTPTAAPIITPTVAPTATSTVAPTATPVVTPTVTVTPTATPVPTLAPTGNGRGNQPEDRPGNRPEKAAPQPVPSAAPVAEPVVTPEPGPGERGKGNPNADSPRSNNERDQGPKTPDTAPAPAPQTGRPDTAKPETARPDAAPKAPPAEPPAKGKR